MPYIVTTHRHLDDPTAEFLPGSAPGVSRRAVATLDGEQRVRNHEGGTYAVFLRAEYGKPWELIAGPFSDAKVANEAKRAILGLPEQGGTAAPLPDGTVIEVEPALWRELDPNCRFKHQSGPAVPENPGEIIAAYNAAQEAKVSSGDQRPGSIMALRGEARSKLKAGVDQGKVVYDLIHAGDLEGLTKGDISEIVADLRREGLIEVVA